MTATQSNGDRIHHRQPLISCRRLCADVLNDIAIFVELLAPGYPDYFVALVCFASVAKSIVGVAGGATRAALTQHQARYPTGVCLER